MYSVGLRRKRCILPDKLCEKKNVCKHEKNMCKFPILINSSFQWYHFLFKLSISVTLKFQKTKSDAPVLIKLCLPVTSINLISFIRVFVSFLCCHGLWSFLRCLFLFVFCCFCCCLLSLFSLVFISGQNFTSSSSKDAAATTAVVELIIRTITV